MGMYTEFVIAAAVKNMHVVVDPLHSMAYGIANSKSSGGWPCHPFFKTSRGIWMFKSASAYFTPRAAAIFEYDDISSSWSLIVRCDLKNYDGEIALFLDWMRPYWARPDTMIGYSRYEQTREPTIHYSPCATENGECK